MSSAPDPNPISLTPASQTEASPSDVATLTAPLPLSEMEFTAVEDMPEPDDELTHDVEMSLFDHLEELRQRIFYSLIAIVLSIIICFTQVRWIVQFLEVPAQGAKFLQLGPGEYFFVSCKVAAYCGILVASPMLIYQAIRFILPGLTRREQRVLGPVVFGSTTLFAAGLAFAYSLLMPAALKFFISYGADVVEQIWSIDRYFDFVLLLLFASGLAFQVPVLQLLLVALRLVTVAQMLAGWRLVILAAVILGAVLTPSIDPITQGLFGGALVTLYFGGIGLAILFQRSTGTSDVKPT